MSRIALALLLVLFCRVAPAFGLVESSTHVSATLIANSGAFSPGKPILLGLHLEMAPGWHTYWLNPGDSGLPTALGLKLPPRWKAAPLQWPIPKKYVEPGELITYGYSGEVLLMLEVTPPDDLAPGDVTLQARASWLACETTCVPGSAELELTLPVAEGAQATNRELFDKFKALLPLETPPPFKTRWEPHDTEFHLKVSGIAPETKVDFFPFDPGSAPITVLSPGLFRVPLPSVESTDPPAPPPSVAGVVVTESPDGLERRGWKVQFSQPARGATTSPSPLSTPSDNTTFLTNPSQKALAAANPPNAELNLPTALFYGFIGGIILNLMPCVLPVIALKLLGFLGQAGQSRRKVFRIGLAFSAGIFAWFFLMAGLVTVAKAIGHEVNWAFQFQNPRIVGGMIVIVFVFALNLLGVFEVWLPGGGRLAGLAEREGYTGAFLHGAFATLLATPCTAPFLGPALAFAFSQNALTTFTMFAAVAGGMSTPYLLLSWQPGWMRFLPKPGDWMVRLKQVMGFLMLGTVVWLLTVVAGQGGVPQLSAMLWLLLGIGIASWIAGTWLLPHIKVSTRFAALGVIALVIFAAYTLGKAKDEKGGISWQPWSTAAVLEAQRQGKVVFIDFTADWCVNCKFNEKFVLETPPVQQAMKSVATFKADWTKGDPLITAELKKLKRAGVPVYAVFSPKSDVPEVLPELLTQEIVLEALKRAAK